MKKIICFILIFSINFTSVVFAQEEGEREILPTDISQDLEFSVDTTLSSPTSYDVNPNYFYYAQNNQKRYQWSDKYVSGLYSYCIEADVEMYSKLELETINPNSLYTSETWEYLSLLAMYGENYFLETADYNYRFATQLLIHEKTNPEEGRRFLVDKFDNIVDLNKYKSDILTSVVNHHTIPEFNLLDVVMYPDMKYTFEDNNNVLRDFDVVNSSADIANIYVDNNTMVVDTLGVGEINFDLIKHSTKPDLTLMFWNHEKTQNQLTVTGFSKTGINLKLVVTNPVGKVTINKTDSNSGQLIDGASFELYRVESNQTLTLVYDNLTTTNGIIVIDNLLYGEYQLLEVASPVGYQLSTTPTTFVIDETNNDLNLTITNHPILVKTGVVNLSPIFSIFTLALFTFKLLFKKLLS